MMKSDQNIGDVYDDVNDDKVKLCSEATSGSGSQTSHCRQGAAVSHDGGCCRRCYCSKATLTDVGNASSDDARRCGCRKCYSTLRATTDCGTHGGRTSCTVTWSIVSLFCCIVICLLLVVYGLRLYRLQLKVDEMTIEIREMRAAALLDSDDADITTLNQVGDNVSCHHWTGHMQACIEAIRYACAADVWFLDIYLFIY